MRLGRHRRPARRIRRGWGDGEARGDFRAVEVVPCEDACAAVRRLEQRRVLVRFIHLFPLPLPECNASQCRCSYRHHADRRNEDRRLPFGSGGVSNERRSGADRRAGWDTPFTRSLDLDL